VSYGRLGVFLPSEAAVSWGVPPRAKVPWRQRNFAEEAAEAGPPGGTGGLAFAACTECEIVA
jgi:hypothetical protein